MSKKVGRFKEDGHDDVASAIRQCNRICYRRCNANITETTNNVPADTLPTWWSNKLAIASNSMNKIRVIGMSSNHRGANDIAKNNDMKKLKVELQNASKMHLAQSRGDRLIRYDESRKS